VKLDRAVAIKDGWMSVQELEWLAEHASKHERIVEIGSWTGRSTRAIVDNTEGTVVAVDTWLGSAGDLDDVIARLGKWWSFRRFHFNLADSFDRISVMRMDSLAAALELTTKGQKFDMIFIDACHDYASVAADIKAWRTLLSPGGLICGHDFTPRWAGVMQAVRELIPDFRLMDAPSTDRTIWWKE
jgi:predicted O-methyltransferase YrrM